MSRLLRRVLVLTLVLALGGVALAVALPQQQGAVQLANESDGELDGPAGAAAGSAVTSLGDVNGDGTDDVAVGAPEASPSGRNGAGSVYVVFGRRDRSDPVDLSALAGRGLRIDGSAAGDGAGFSLTRVSISGRRLLVVGAPHSGGDRGRAYVIDVAALTDDVDLSAANPAVRTISGPAGTKGQLGYGVASPGDVDGDGTADLVLGAPTLDGGTTAAPKLQAGAAFVVFGGGSGDLDLSAPGTSAARIDGAAADDAAGSAVAGGPVVAGRASVLVGAPGAAPGGRTAAGAAFVVAGRASRASVDLASLEAGDARLDGAATQDGAGAALALTGDLDADGVAEIAIGAPGADPAGRRDAGRTYLVPVTAAVGATTLGAAATPTLDGANANDGAGFALARIADLNGDGRDELAIGAPFVNTPELPDAGAAYVVFGRPGNPQADLGSLGSRGITLTGAHQADEAGYALTAGGDLNGDGRPDLLIGAPFALSTTRAAGGVVYESYGFGPAVLSYTPPSRTGTAGGELDPLVPTFRATGRPRFAVAPALPAGLTLSPTSGRITGTPTGAAEPADYTVTMTDLAGEARAIVRLSIAPSPTATPTVTTTTPGRTVTAAGPGATPPGACVDRQAPISSFTSAHVRRTGLRIRGRSRDRGCASGGTGTVARVQLAVGREVGRKCAYLTGRRLGPPGDCRRAVYTTARGTTNWVLERSVRLPVGRYKIYVRGTDTPGNVERKAGARTFRRVRVR